METFPKDIEGYAFLVLSAIQNNNPTAVLESLDLWSTALQRVFHLEDKSINFNLTKGHICLVHERLEQALHYLELATQEMPDFGPAWFERGYLLFELGRVDEALEMLNIASSLASKEGNIHERDILRIPDYQLVQKYLDQGETLKDSAKELFENPVEHDLAFYYMIVPQWLEHYKKLDSQRAIYFYQAGRMKECLEAIDQQQKRMLVPELDMIRALVLYDQGNPESVGSWKKYLDQGPVDEYTYIRATLTALTFLKEDPENYRLSKEWMETAIQKYPQNLVCYVFRVYCDLFQNDVPGAKESCKRLIEIFPTPHSRAKMASFEMLENNFENAYKDILKELEEMMAQQKIWQHPPQDDEDFIGKQDIVQGILQAGMVLYLAGRKEESSDIIEKALSVLGDDPLFADYYVAIADIMLGSNKPGLALNYVKKYEGTESSALFLDSDNSDKVKAKQHAILDKELSSQMSNSTFLSLLYDAPGIPLNHDALYLKKGLALLEIGDIQAASQILTQRGELKEEPSLSQEPYSASCIADGQLKMFQGKTEDSITTLNSCHDFLPHRPKLRSLRAFAKMQKGDYEAALAELEDTPTNYSILLQKAALFALLGKEGEAQTLFHEAELLDYASDTNKTVESRTLDTYFKTIVLSQIGKVSAAAVELENLQILQKSQNLETTPKMRTVVSKLPNEEEVIRGLIARLQGLENLDTLTEEAKKESELRRERVRERLDGILKKVPLVNSEMVSSVSSEIHRLQGDSLFLSGDKVAALKEYRESTRENSNNAWAYLLQAYTEYYLKEYEAAEESFNKASTLYNLNADASLPRWEKSENMPPPGTRNYYRTVGSLYYKLGENEKAIDFYSKAIASEQHAEDYYKKGKILQNVNQYDEAINMYDKVLAIDSEEGSEIRRKAALNKVIVEVKKLEASQHIEIEN
eukprot:TRINITY_DN5109_c0_g1_i1.p1 TRINITY_DN5109_c0_g1~~TRINITY_DN5109_c0_g1_i1.p1  ORF type:complete len:1070 (+),score=246.47 TRINITY_DN5109_c0_g1_i1:437-3211(+)